MAPKEFQPGRYYRTRYPDDPSQSSRGNHFPNAHLPASAVPYSVPADVNATSHNPTVTPASDAPDDQYHISDLGLSIPVPLKTYAPYPALDNSTAPYIRPRMPNPSFSTQRPMFDLGSVSVPNHGTLQDVSSHSNMRPSQQRRYPAPPPASMATYGMINTWMSTNIQVNSVAFLSLISRCSFLLASNRFPPSPCWWTIK